MLEHIPQCLLTVFFSNTEAEGVVRVHLRNGLCGGKGGFGALLRGGNNKSGNKVTNHSSYRDLSGRRIGDVQNEQALQQWTQSESSGLSRSQMNERFRRINQGLDPEIRACKFGADCRYKEKCEFEHPALAEKEKEKEKEKEVVDLGYKESNSTSAILQGMAMNRSVKRKPARLAMQDEEEEESIIDNQKTTKKTRRASK
jgi:hypothetical protein